MVVTILREIAAGLPTISEAQQEASMRREPNSDPLKTQAPNLTPRAPQSSVNSNSQQRSIAERGALKLIPWEDIWDSLRGARIRGHGEMIEVFYETLFKEAIFDDHGAWSEDRLKRN